MEKGVDFHDYMTQVFQIKEVDIALYSPLTLAYIGDCVYDLIIKNIVIGGVNRPVQQLHKETSKLVQASAQSAMMRHLQEVLSPQELAVYKRGRNTKSVTPAKNQSITDYRRATGFEALIGYLYLDKQHQRILELVKIGLEAMKSENNKS